MVALERMLAGQHLEEHAAEREHVGAFVPIVGALASGMIAVLIALVAQGPITALLMLAGVIAVQQIESHVLQPFLLGRAVSVHPLAVILAITAGVVIAGIVGALVAVPVAAVVNAVVKHLTGSSGADDATSTSAGAGEGSADPVSGLVEGDDAIAPS